MSHAKNTVHRVVGDDGEVSFVISAQHCWLPGSYADEKAASFAFRFDDEVLSRLRDVANSQGRLITYEDLAACKKP